MVSSTACTRRQGQSHRRSRDRGQRRAPSPNLPRCARPGRTGRPAPVRLVHAGAGSRTRCARGPSLTFPSRLHWAMRSQCRAGAVACRERFAARSASMYATRWLSVFSVVSRASAETIRALSSSVMRPRDLEEVGVHRVSRSSHEATRARPSGCNRSVEISMESRVAICAGRTQYRPSELYSPNDSLNPVMSSGRASGVIGRVSPQCSGGIDRDAQ